MKDSCIVAPIHEPYFYSYGMDFVKSYNKWFDDDHLFLVFSSENEKIKFKQIAGNLKYQSIVCDEVLGPSPITQKKYFGIKKIYESTSFNYVGCFDVDTLFICHKEYDTLFKNFISRKTFFCSKITGLKHVQNIVKYPASFYSESDQEQLRYLTNNFLYYFWFNDVPVYERESYCSFLKYINYEQQFHRLTYETFDYILYGYYMSLKHDFKLIPIIIDNEIAIHDYGFLEGQHKFNKDYFSNCFEVMNPMWIKIDIEQEKMKNVFVRLHVHSPYK